MPSDIAPPAATPLAEAGRCLDELDRALRAAQARMDTSGPCGLDFRRVRTDLVHLRESLALLCDTSAARSGTPTVGAQWAPRTLPMVDVPDTPYDPAMWQDADDEGIGCRHG
jgi:hypothetical protein